MSENENSFIPGIIPSSSLNPREIEWDLRKAFPNKERIKIEEGLEIIKMVSGIILVNGYQPIHKLETKDLQKIRNYLLGKQ